VASKTYNLSLPPALLSKAVISANWEDFLISSQGSKLTSVLLRKQIIPISEGSGWGPSPSALKGGQLLLRHAMGQVYFLAERIQVSLGSTERMKWVDKCLA